MHGQWMIATRVFMCTLFVTWPAAKHLMFLLVQLLLMLLFAMEFWCVADDVNLGYGVALLLPVLLLLSLLLLFLFLLLFALAICYCCSNSSFSCCLVASSIIKALGRITLLKNDAMHIIFMSTTSPQTQTHKRA
jgi:uncharacterized membrane protein